MSATQTESSIRREELDRLQAELSSRASTLHLAHAGISTMVGLILGGAAGKLGWDANRLQSTYAFCVAVSVASASILIYGAVCLIRGRSELRSEKVMFTQLMSMRQSLGLDDPSALLPPK